VFAYLTNIKGSYTLGRSETKKQ